MVRFYLDRGASPSWRSTPRRSTSTPTAPFFPISEPPEYAGDLAREIGLYYTTGMVEDHTGLNNERISEEAFLDQCEIAWREREAMMLARARVVRRRAVLLPVRHARPHPAPVLAISASPTTRPTAARPPTPTSPRSSTTPTAAATRSSARRSSTPTTETLFIALSDHGFNSFRRGVASEHVALRHGFLALKDGIRPGEEAGDLLRQVDWGRTRAYALGLSGIYLNLKGREEQGIVPPEEAEAVKADAGARA